MKDLCRRIAIRIYHLLSKRGGRPYQMLHDAQVYQDMRLLEPTKANIDKHKEYVIEKLALCVLILLVGMTLSVLFILQEWQEEQVVDNALYRNAYGAGTREVTLIANTEEEEVLLTVELGEKEYTLEELMDMEEAFYEALTRELLGENESLDTISYDLQLVTGVVGYPFKVDWMLEESEYIDAEGHLLKDTLEGSVRMELIADVRCGEFQKYYVFPVELQSRSVPISLEEKLRKELQRTEAASRKEDFFLLPSEYQEEQIVWKYEKSARGAFFLLLTPLTAVLIYFGKDKDLHKKVEERQEQLMLDYPELVTKLALLVGAGMTVANAWNRIATDYRTKREMTGERRFAYEEMLITIYELESGISQKEAFEHFGKRCRAPCYIKLATLLSQNLRKGSTNVFEILQEEAALAFDDRKKLAKKKGEQAGTKLLFPMMILLGIVMVLMIVPAFTGLF